ncbi:MAG: HAD family hydrolase [Candidatus Thermoplasmatota archaeon]|nr:HAD family hydrolase [Candidatus Thermoplasmatota archaeon]
MNYYRPKALLFDFDGVLINSIDSWWMSLNEAFHYYGYPRITKKEFTERYWGHDLKDILPHQNMDLGIATFCANIYHKYFSFITLYEDTISTLQNLDAFQKAIITNTPSNCTHPLLKRLQINKYFTTVVCSDEVKKAKPYPDLIYEACRRLKIHPSEALMIGDTSSDIEDAYRAGCTIIGKKIQGDSTIADLSDLLRLIKPP